MCVLHIKPFFLPVDIVRKYVRRHRNQEKACAVKGEGPSVPCEDLAPGSFVSVKGKLRQF